MREYKIRVIETRTDIFLRGALTIYKNYYLIIDEEGLAHRYPIKKTIIDEINKQ
jgi:hypothetical protein